MANYLDNDIKFVAGVGEARARLLERKLGIRTLGDMLWPLSVPLHRPYEDLPHRPDRGRGFRTHPVPGRITGVSYAGAGANDVSRPS